MSHRYAWKQLILKVVIFSLTTCGCNTQSNSSDFALIDQYTASPSTSPSTSPSLSPEGDEEEDFYKKVEQSLKNKHKLWIAGFSIAFVFSILNTIGINLQKYSLHRESVSSTNTKQRRKSCLQPLWVLGFVLVFIGSIMDFVAFGLAPQSLLSPLAALSLVWNLLIAPVFHNETITRSNLIATGIIVGGVTISVIFAGRSTPSYNLDDLIRMYETTLMRIYIGVVGSFLVVLLAGKNYIEYTGKGENGVYHVVCYGGIAGTVGGESVLLAKSTVELIKTVMFGEGIHSDAFHHFESYVIMIGMVFCLLVQIVTLNEGLRRFDSLVIFPVYQSFWILTSVLGGIMYFEEYRNMSRLNICMFTIGATITICGIISLLKFGHKPERTESSGSLMEYSGFVVRGGSCDVNDNQPDTKM